MRTQSSVYINTRYLFASTQYFVKTDTMFNDDDIISIENAVIKKLKFFREERNLSQFELSLQSGVSQNMITYIETGKRSPTLKTVIKLCKALEISPAKLFEESDDEREQAKKKIIEAIQKYM